MILKLGINSSPKKTMNKSVDYPEVGQKTGYLKEETDVVNPTFLVEGIEHLFYDYNYVQVPQFGRVYFITGITSVRKGLVAISCHCDVLSSAANELAAQPCIVAASQRGFNKRINDGSFKVYQYRKVINDFPFPNSFTTPGDYVLALAGS